MSVPLSAIEQNDLASLVPRDLFPALVDPRRDLPALAHDSASLRRIESTLKTLPSVHDLYRGDARGMDFLAAESVHVVVTSPPYWNLKRYRETVGQLGNVTEYPEFLSQLDLVWRRCFDALVPGGRLACVIGDVCLSRRQNGRHAVVPLHSAVQERCRAIGFDNLAPIIWYKISNAACEAGNGTTFLGKPYEPNAVIKNDVEYILLLRKPGGYRRPSLPARVASLISVEHHRQWFRQVWADIPGASSKTHPAPFPVKLAERLIRMFSFVGDTVLDPFLGSGTTTIAAAKHGRHSIGVELDPVYFEQACKRIETELRDLPSGSRVRRHDKAHEG